MGEPYTDETRALGTSLTVGPGVKNHVVFAGATLGSLRLRFGIDGELAYDLTQGLMHQALGFHGVPHKETTSTFFELGVDLGFLYGYDLGFVDRYQ